MAKKKGRTLTDRQISFCLEYMRDPNGSRAARAAGYSGSDAVVGTTAWRLLKKAEVIAYLDEARDRKAKAAIMSAQEVVAELSRLAGYDLGDSTDENGAPRTLRQMPENLRRAAEGYERDRKGNVKYKFATKSAALALLAKHYKLTSDTVNITGSLTLEDLITGSQQEPE